MSKSRPRREYLIPTDNIIVLDHLFNFAKKSNLIGRLLYDLTQFFDNLVVAYFFGPPCIVTMEYGSCFDIDQLMLQKQVSIFGLSLRVYIVKSELSLARKTDFSAADANGYETRT